MNLPDRCILVEILNSGMIIIIAGMLIAITRLVLKVLFPRKVYLERT